MTEEQITDFIAVSGSNRRTAMFFLVRQNGNLNNAVEDFFNNIDMEIPSSFVGDNQGPVPDAVPNPPVPSRALSEQSSSNSIDYSPSDNEPLSPPAPENSVSGNEAKNVTESNFFGIEPLRLVLDQPIEVIEPEDEKIFEPHSFPPQTSEGESEKITVFKNGLFYQNKFHEKSQQDMNVFLTGIQCGDLPSNIFCSNVVDIELVDERSHSYSK